MASVSLIGMNENAHELGNIKACALGNLSDLLPFQVGHSWLPRCQSTDQSPGSGRGLHVLRGSLPYMESLLTCLQMNWMAILVRVRFSLASSLRVIPLTAVVLAGRASFLWQDVPGTAGRAARGLQA